MEKPTVGALAASALDDGEQSEQSKADTTSEGRPQSAGSEATIRARAKLAKAHFENGLKYRRGGDSGRALVDFLKATREDPKLVEAYYEQALIFREKGFHKLAVSRLEQAISIKGQYQKARLLLATIKLEQGNVSDAVEQLGASLGLPKSTATAIKPDASEEHENKTLGIPPMILQSVHTAMPVARRSESAGQRIGQRSRPQNRTASAQSNPDFDQDEQPTFEGDSPKASPPKPAVRRKPGSRRKVRELMARKYGKNNSSKKQERMSWIAKIFSWPEPFKFVSGSDKSEKIAADDPTEDELQPRGASNLVAEFQTEDKAKASAEEADAEEEYTPHFPQTKKTLFAYNGDPVDTIDLVSEKIPDRKLSENSHRSAPKVHLPPKVQQPPEETPAPKKENSWSLEKIYSAKDEAKQSAPTEPEHKPTESKSSSLKTRSVSHRTDDNDDSESGAKTFALSARQVKIASKGFLDYKPDDEPAKKAIARKPLVKPPVAQVEDEWTRRLRFLAENGTSSLKTGEAFMFSEDTGEAVLFTRGQRIRRVIADAQETQDVLKLRRPDVLVPKELFYNTALLGKVVNSPPPPAPPTTELHLPESSSTEAEAPSLEPPGFKIEQMMDNPTGFWNWFKGLVNL